MAETIEVYTGDEVAVDVLNPLDGGGSRVEIDVVDGPRFRLDVNSTGNDYDVVTSWNRHDELADVEVPAYVEDVMSRLARA
ncbi:hypothetical protein [Halobellus rufus]|uniref:hypothetical protein n=1 Tax=Halobellus rufus TaxID=1448860 RepID=UPI00067953C0|nr:hypothetical protein [Halobellus rufus]